MLPRATKLTSLDVYRDGGSVSASFLSDDKIEYCLLFPVKMDKDMGNIGYLAPVLELFIPSLHTSKITGEQTSFHSRESRPVSWQDASFILEQLASYLSNFTSEYMWVFPEMVRASKNEGSRIDS